VLCCACVSASISNTVSCCVVRVQVLVDVTGTEFVLLIKLLHSLKVMQTLLGRQQLVEIITEQADLDTPFNVSA
jgi:hypothetical protein